MGIMARRRQAAQLKAKSKQHPESSQEHSKDKPKKPKDKGPKYEPFNEPKS